MPEKATRLDTWPAGSVPVKACPILMYRNKHTHPYARTLTHALTHTEGVTEASAADRIMAGATVATSAPSPPARKTSKKRRKRKCHGWSGSKADKRRKARRRLEALSSVAPPPSATPPTHRQQRSRQQRPSSTEFVVRPWQLDLKYIQPVWWDMD